MDNARPLRSQLRDASQYVIVIRQAGGKFSLRNCRRSTHSRNFYAAIFMTSDVQNTTIEPSAFAPRKCTDLTQSRIDPESFGAAKMNRRSRLYAHHRCDDDDVPDVSHIASVTIENPRPPRFQPLILSTAEE